MNLKSLKLKKDSKIKLKCFFTLILVFTMVISSIPNVNVFANESYEYNCISEDIFGYALKQTLKDVQPNTQYPKNNVMPMLFNVKHRDDNDDIYSKVYCLDVNTPINDDTDYSISNIEDSDYYTDENAKKIRAILKNSYPYVGLDKLVDNIRKKTNDPNFNLNLEKYTGNAGITSNQYKNAYDISRVAITATQLAIWKYSNNFIYKGLQKHNLGEVNETERYSDEIIKNVEKLYYKLLELAEENAEEAEVPVTEIVSKEAIIVSENGNTVDIEFRFKIDGDIIDDNINYTIENRPDNSEIIESNELDEDGYKRVKITNIPQGKDIKFVISVTQDIDKENIVLYKPEGGREVSQNFIGAHLGVINISKEFNCVFGQVEVTKVDSDDPNIRLEGAKFTIRKYPSGEFVNNIITKEDGTASAKLFPGEYTIEETQAPEGYKKSNEIKKFTIKDDKTIIGINFNNKKLIPDSVILEVTKILIGQGIDLVEDMFSFKLLDQNGNEVEMVKNDAQGKIKFSELTFNKVGTYTYQIVEVNEGLEGMTYDSRSVDVTIDVQDNGSGKLEASVSYPSKEPVFKNKYKLGSTSAAIEGTKILEGKDLESGMFSFKLLDEKENILQIVKNNRNGKIYFEDITYDKVGTYKYIVREFNGNLPGIVYDESEFEVTVKVTDDGKGNLVSEVVYPRGGVVFNNSYEAGATSATIEGTKKLTGKDLETGMFSFDLLDEDNKVLQTVENSADGKVQFEAITYDKVGEYKYKVREVKDTLSGVIYDKSEFEVTVKVKDDGKGNLVSEVVYPEGGVIFTNAVIKGTLEFKKTDVSTGEAIEGAEIKITCIEGLDKGKVIEFTSSKEGNKFELKAGKYTFEETQAPEGYELTKEVGTFEIKENGEIVKVELKNYPIKGSAKLIKVDKDDDEKRIQGAKFVLLGSDKETIIAENLVTDSEGKIIVSNLQPGTYYFKEIEAASGYILDETLIEVKVESNQQTISTVTFENEKEQDGGGFLDTNPEGDSTDTDSNVSSPNTNNNTNSNVSSPNTNTNNNTNSNVNSSTNSSGSYPKTSDISIAGYAISGIVSIGTLVGINRKRKDK